MIILHMCPVHGEERCLMGEDGKAHGCRLGMIEPGYWPSRTVEMATIRKAASWVLEAIRA